jgi:hypothetical protein
VVGGDSCGSMDAIARSFWSRHSGKSKQSGECWPSTTRTSLSSRFFVSWVRPSLCCSLRERLEE